MHGGHGRVPVGCASRIQPKNFSASKPGAQQIEAPAESEDETAAIRPWMWNSGITLRQRSCGVSASVAAMCRAEAAMLDCSSGTTLGRDVVPEVCRISATSSGPGVARRLGCACGRGHQPELAGRQIGLRLETQDGDAERLRRRNGRTVGARRHDQRPGLQVFEVEGELFLAIGPGSAAPSRRTARWSRTPWPSPARWAARWRPGPWPRCRSAELLPHTGRETPQAP